MEKKKEENAVNKGRTIKEYPARERPYEKLSCFGGEYLTDAELLAIILKTGTKNRTSVDIAREVLLSNDGYGGLENIRTLSIEELMKISGVGWVKAVQLKAVSELAKRLAVAQGEEKTTIKTADDVKALLMPQMKEYCKEVVKAVFLNTKNGVIRVMDISIGSLSASIVHPREVFREAVKCSAAGVIICHNHPSGDPTPSVDDISTTKRLIEAGTVMGIQVLDHLVFGAGQYRSIMELIVNE